MVLDKHWKLLWEMGKFFENLEKEDNTEDLFQEKSTIRVITSFEKDDRLPSGGYKKILHNPEESISLFSKAQF